MLRLSIPHADRPFFGPTVLIYYDGPQVFWLPVAGRSLLAIAIADAGPWPFLVVELTLEQAIGVGTQSLTLADACRGAKGQWLMPDYDAEELVLEPLAVIPVDWMPNDDRQQLKGT